MQQSAIGNGININGAVNRGGTALLADGANIIDPGNMASSVSIVNPEMVAEVSVQASNFGADTAFGPVVVSTISKSGGQSVSWRRVLRRPQQRLERERLEGQPSGSPTGTPGLLLPWGQLRGSSAGYSQEALLLGRL